MVGSIRNIKQTHGGHFRERLLSLSDLEHSQTYMLLDPPLSDTSMITTLRLYPITDGERSYLSWSSEVVVGKQDETSFINLLHDSFMIGIDNLQSGERLMAGRLQGKVAVVIGAASAGPGWGNGKASVVLFAREGAKVLCVDRHGAAHATVDLIKGEGGEAETFDADVTVAAQRHGRALCRALRKDRHPAQQCRHRPFWRPGRDQRGELGPRDADQHHVAVPDLQAHPADHGNAAGWRDRQQELERRYPLSGRLVDLLRLEQGGGHSVHPDRGTQRKGICANAIVLGVVRTPVLENWITQIAKDDPDKMWRYLDEKSPCSKIGDAWDAAHAALFPPRTRSATSTAPRSSSTAA